MIRINNYIQEKLHLTKEYKFEPLHEFTTTDERVFIVSIDDMHLRLYSYLRFIEIKKNKIYYYVARARKGNPIDQKIKLNTHNYYECNIGFSDTDNKFIAIFMPAKDGIEFINELIDIPEEELNNFLMKYFDKKDARNLENKEIDNQYDIHDLRSMIRELEDA